ncbi:MAG TPA: PDZ domain-containing protein, partial [Planctomycetaceae bacterium]|nr:PDZ domain-containing protein [Planctomycetaceae bacterium]
DLRRMAFGGMVLEAMTDDERKDASLTADKMALRVKHVGQYGEHARAKQAGLLKDDIVISYDGIDAARTESELLAHAMQNKRRDDAVQIVALRGKERKTFTVKLQ